MNSDPCNVINGYYPSIEVLRLMIYQGFQIHRILSCYFVVSPQLGSVGLSIGTTLFSDWKADRYVFCKGFKTISTSLCEIVLSLVLN